MDRYATVFMDALVGYARYLSQEVTQPTAGSYFYGLILVSAAVYLAERLWPWRPQQPPVREGFWLDLFYLFFNFFLFSLLGYHALASTAARLVDDALAGLGLSYRGRLDVSGLPAGAQLALLFVVRDFIQYWVHRLLHAVPWLWRVHQVHHSVRQMGFAAHMRFHWLETVFYRGLEYLPLGLIGFGLQEFFAVHMLALTIGHLNHANLHLPIGPLRYLLNSPQMHLWHHARCLAPGAANYGISLSLWDWLFGTVHWPADDPDLALGFEGVEGYPPGFWGQSAAPFRPGRAAPAGPVGRR